MQRNQIGLEDRPLKKNKEFLKGLYETSDLVGVRRWFDKLEGSIERKYDPNITLEKFLDLMTESFFIVLQTGSPFLDDIRCCSRGSDDQGSEVFAWIECPYNEYNYNVVSGLFKEVYDQDVDSIPVSEALKLYHKRFGLD